VGHQAYDLTSLLTAHKKTRGAVKSNIGHLEGASGLAGIIKAVLALERGIIPPNANFENPNSKIDVDFLRLRVSPQFCEEKLWLSFE
jgi:acyl transferase domain-containing protein